MTIYVKFERNKLVCIPGTCTTVGREDWIEATGVSFMPPAATTTGSTGDGSGAPPPASELAFSKLVDAASPRLQMAAHDGTLMTVSIDITGSTAGSSNDTLTFVAADGIVAAVVMGTGQNKPSEAVVINYTILTTDYHHADADASDQVPPKYRENLPGYDLTAGYVY